jgi:hypothetical protein
VVATVRGARMRAMATRVSTSDIDALGEFRAFSLSSWGKT